MLIETNKLNSMELFQMLSSSILPRPIAWVGSISANAVPNLAPYSLFSIASVTPPMISIVVLNRPGGADKDTLSNIKETEVFSVSVVSRDLVKSMSATGMEFPPDVNEFESSGLSQVECETIACVRCAEAKLSLECKLREVLKYGDDGTSDSLILADVVAINIDDSIMRGPQIDLDKLDPVGHLIGPLYSTTREKITPMS